MKILFLNLPHSRPVIRRYKCSYDAAFFLFPPWELLSMATAAREHGADVQVIDAIAERLTPTDIVSRLQPRSFDAVISLTGIEIIQTDLDVIRQIKNGIRDTPTIVCGYLPSFFPGDALRRTGADAVMRFEMEQTLIDLIESRSMEKREWLAVPGMAVLDSGRVKSSPARALIDDFSALPRPDRRLLDVHRYRAFLMPAPATVAVTSRGCPFRCEFCIRSYPGYFRPRSADDVLAEWEEIQSLGVRSVAVLDDTFFVHKERDREILKGFAEKPRLAWTCMTRVDVLDEELLSLAREAGCRRVTVGIESVVDDSLIALRKGYGVDEVRRGFEKIERAGIEFNGLFIMGIPGADKEIQRSAARMIRDSPLSFINIMSYTEYPGAGRDFDPVFDDEDGEIPEIRVRRAEILDELKFYLLFYCTISRLKLIGAKLIKHPWDVLTAIAAMLKYLLETPFRSRQHQRFL